MGHVAAAGGSPEGPLRRARDAERLPRQRRELEAEREALREERRSLERRRKALDEREAGQAAPGLPPAETAPETPPDEVLQPEFRRWNLRVLRKHGPMNSPIASRNGASTSSSWSRLR